MRVLPELLIIWMAVSVIVCATISRAVCLFGAQPDEHHWSPRHPSLQLARVKASRPRPLR